MSKMASGYGKLYCFRLWKIPDPITKDSPSILWSVKMHLAKNMSFNRGGGFSWTSTTYPGSWSLVCRWACSCRPPPSRGRCRPWRFPARCRARSGWQFNRLGPSLRPLFGPFLPYWIRNGTKVCSKNGPKSDPKLPKFEVDARILFKWHLGQFWGRNNPIELPPWLQHSAPKLKFLASAIRRGGGGGGRRGPKKGLEVATRFSPLRPTLRLPIWKEKGASI